MLRRPPRSTLTDTLFPYTTLFRSMTPQTVLKLTQRRRQISKGRAVAQRTGLAFDQREVVLPVIADLVAIQQADMAGDQRSEERRVGKECVSTCRSRWSPHHYKKKRHQTPRYITYK